MSRSSRRTAVTAVFLLVLPLASAAGQRLAFARLAQENGLSNGTVTALAQDRIGFLWLGTEDGLNRYDGSGFTLFRPVRGDTTSLADGWVTQLMPAGDGGLWVATLHGGLHHYDQRTGRFRRYRAVPDDSTKLPSNQINALYEGTSGMLWLGTSDGLARLDPASGTVRRYPIVGGDSAALANDVVALAGDARGRIWVGARGGLFVVDPVRGDVERLDPALQTRMVRTLLRDRRGRIWVGTEDELLVLDAKSRSVLHRYGQSTEAHRSPVAGRVMVLSEDPDGTIWIGGDDGIVAFDPATDRFVRHTSEPGDRRSLGGNIVRSVLVDRGGVLWVGLESYGVSRHAPSAVMIDLIEHDPGSPNTLSDGYIRGITEDRRGDLWIATQFGGLNRVDGRTGRIRAYRHVPGQRGSLPGDNTWAVLEDRGGTFWVGLHSHGLGVFDRETGTFTRSRAVPSDASVNVLYEDRAGALLVGLENRGLVEISPDRQKIRSYGAQLGDERVLADDDVQAILEDREGMLWIGGAVGLTRLDRRTGAATHYRNDGWTGSLASDFVTNLVEDRQGHIWVATKGGGLNRFDRDTGRFHAIGTAEGLPHSFVYGILEDARGRLWLSTDAGLAMLDPVSGAVTRFGLEDGLQAREFNRRAHYRSASGVMYFGGINGVNVLRPDELAKAPPPPAVAILSLSSPNGPYRRLAGYLPGTTVELRTGESAFTVAFAALDYTAPAKTRYAYRLDGHDHRWILAGARREATYSGLAPGRYIFRVTAANAAGLWHPIGESIAIVIPRPWWATWWARLAGVLLAVGLPVAAFRIRTRAVRRRSAWLEGRVESQTRDLIDAQQRLRDALDRERRSARELREITATVPGAVFRLRVDAEGHRAFTFVSDGAGPLAVDHVEERDVAADPRHAALRMLDRVHRDDVVAIQRAMARARDARKPWRGELRLAGDGHEPRWLSVHARPSHEPDGSTVWTGVAMDTTTLRRAEAERAALEAKMLHAQKAESLGVLAGGIAHDFNNLLVGVLANAELLREMVGPDGEAAETTGHIRAAALRAAELTQQMLAYAGKGRFVIGRVDLASISREMVALLRSVVPRTVGLDLDTDAGSVGVEADATQLRQVILNLVTNASEAVGERGGHIRVRVGVDPGADGPPALMHAAPDMPRTGPYALLEVRDDGCGMDPATLERIFDPFYSTKFTGRGLGLAALLGIVRAHHGGLQVITAAGEGACFRIYFPLVAAEAPATAQGSVGPVPPHPPMRVLLVDDEDVVRLAAARALRKLNYEIVTAADGADALAVLDAGEPVDLVLMDVTMPELDGPCAARELRARGVGVPIVLMSGYAEEELLARGVMGDADGFLKKPFALPELLAVLQEVAAKAGDRVAQAPG